MEASVEISEKQVKFPSVSFLQKQEVGWLYSTPVSKKAYFDPVREEFSPAVGIGNGSWVARRWRSDINAPFRYEIFPGYLHIEFAGLVIPAKQIKKLLEKEGLLTGEDADIFVENIRSAFHMYEGEIEQDLRTETGKITEQHPLVAYFTIEDDTDVINTITYTVDQIFSARKCEIRDFIKRHREELMTVKVVRKFRVIRE